MKVLTIKMSEKEYTEIHLLNPRETLPEFGGNRHGLIVGKTASLVLLRRGVWGCNDTEYDIHDKGVWKWIADLINEKAAITAIPNIEGKTE